jgi:hypothetical protein
VATKARKEIPICGSLGMSRACAGGSTRPGSSLSPWTGSTRDCRDRRTAIERDLHHTEASGRGVDFGSLGRVFVKTDIAEADRETVIRNFLSGQYSSPLRVVAFNTAEGWSRDVSEDVASEVLERAFDADLGEDTKRFIDRHTTPGDKRPAAPSVRRDIGAGQVSRMGARKTGMQKSPGIARA